MSNPGLEQLTFAAVNDLALAAERGRLGNRPASRLFVPTRLGPLIELQHFALAGRLEPLNRNPWIQLGGYTEFDVAFTGRRPQWLAPSRRLGFFRTNDDPENGDVTPWVAFCFEAQRAAEWAGFRKAISAGLAGAIEEMKNNIHEHSEASHTGIVAFHAEVGSFEFVIADHGVGVLDSLRKSNRYANLDDHAQALNLALSDGVSRFNEKGRGHGFRQIFVGLANLCGELRFRSGDHGLMIDGRSPTLVTAQARPGASMKGFLVSVRCSL
jgi:hypothetical protein